MTSFCGSSRPSPAREKHWPIVLSSDIIWASNVGSTLRSSPRPPPPLVAPMASTNARDLRTGPSSTSSTASSTQALYSRFETLNQTERYWCDRLPLLQSHGYTLRARLQPGWVPSWVADPTAELLCQEDHLTWPVSPAFGHDLLRTLNPPCLVHSKLSVCTSWTRSACLTGSSF